MAVTAKLSSAALIVPPPAPDLLTVGRWYYTPLIDVPGYVRLNAVLLTGATVKPLGVPTGGVEAGKSGSAGVI